MREGLHLFWVRMNEALPLPVAHGKRGRDGVIGQVDARDRVSRLLCTVGARAVDDGARRSKGDGDARPCFRVGGVSTTTTIIHGSLDACLASSNVNSHPSILAKITKAPPRLCPVSRAMAGSHVPFRRRARQSSPRLVPCDKRRKES